MKGNRNGIFQGTVLAFAWENWIQPAKPKNSQCAGRDLKRVRKLEASTLASACSVLVIRILYLSLSQSPNFAQPMNIHVCIHSLILDYHNPKHPFPMTESESVLFIIATSTQTMMLLPLAGPDLHCRRPHGNQNVEAPTSNNKFKLTFLVFFLFLITKNTN
jgi:hypothetical protein